MRSLGLFLLALAYALQEKKDGTGTELRVPPGTEYILVKARMFRDGLPLAGAAIWKPLLSRLIEALERLGQSLTTSELTEGDIPSLGERHKQIIVRYFTEECGGAIPAIVVPGLAAELIARLNGEPPGPHPDELEEPPDEIDSDE